MRVYPMGGTDYYPYVYLGVKPYNTQEEYEPVGKYFAGRSIEYTASIFLDLINVETGESATGYPQRVAPTQANFSIVSGGYCRIKAWSVTSNASQVSITIERFNPTYTKPIENTYTSVSVTPLDALQSYLNTSYYIDGGAGESVLLQSLTATANGTYTAPARTAYNTVTVNVPAPAIVTKHIRGNGIFSAADDNVDGYSSVIVDSASRDAFFELFTLNDPSKLSIKISTSVNGGKALVQWGDGTEQDTISANDGTTHTYPAIGTYAIAIYPIDERPKSMLYPRIYQGNSEYRTDFLRIPDYKASTINAGGGYNYSYIPQKIEIMLPAGVTTLADGDFTGITTLEKVYMQDTTPPTMAYSWAIPFDGCPNLKAIYVPASAVSAYKAASGWSTYADIIQPMPL